MKRIFSHLKNLLHTVESYPDAHLVSRAQKGDTEAFGKLYMKYIDGIFRFLYIRTGYQQEEAEDLTEMVFYKAWEHISRFKGDGEHVKAWLFTIARNRLTDYYRAYKKHTDVSEHLADESTKPEDTTYHLMLRDDIRRALQELTYDQKELISLKFIEGLSNQEIAQIIGKREDAIRQQQKRALARLQQILKQKGYGKQ
ncbi:sigma-70 family RNA polymerase sigma factor [Candidatus Roizmanbacteria bacterium]|nr:sigma-70 family RNA polymerase sigma factor [Candidatus Roizmanbacteria bacterium]